MKTILTKLNLRSRIALAAAGLGLLTASAPPPCASGHSISLELDKPEPFRGHVSMSMYTLKHVLANIREETRDMNEAVVFENVPYQESTWTTTYQTAQGRKWLAAIAFGECRGQDRLCMIAVEHVAINRANAHLPRRYGATLYDAILHPWAFSCILHNAHYTDPNWKVIKMAMAGKLAPHSPDGIKWTMAKGTVVETMSPRAKDPTHGAVLYHAPYVNPAWAHSPKVVQTAVLSGHIFYRENG